MYCCTGGAATSKEVLEFMRELFNDSYVSEGYGCTEVGYALLHTYMILTYRTNDLLGICSYKFIYEFQCDLYVV